MTEHMPFGDDCSAQMAFRDWANERGGEMALYDGAVVQVPGTPDKWSYGTPNESVGRARAGASRWANSLTVRAGETVEFDGDTFRVVGGITGRQRTAYGRGCT